MSWDEGGRTAFESGWGAPRPAPQQEWGTQRAPQESQSQWGTQNNYRQPPPMMPDEYQGTRGGYGEPAPARSQYMREPTPMPKPAPRVSNADYPDQDQWESAYKAQYNRAPAAAQQQDKDLFNYAQSRSTSNLQQPQQQQRRTGPSSFPGPSNLGKQGAEVIGLPKRKPRARKPVNGYRPDQIDLYARRSHEEIVHRPKRRQIASVANQADIDLDGRRAKPVGPRYGLRCSTPPRRDTDLFGAKGEDPGRFKVGGVTKKADHHYGATNGIFAGVGTSKEHLPGRDRHARRVEPGIHQHTPLEWRE